MPKAIDTQPPKWLAKDPRPKLVEQKFHGNKMLVWQGEVDLDQIEGWTGNPRTELLRDSFREDHVRDPNNEEMCQLVLADEDEKEGLRIKALAENIRKNGVRVPIVLTFDRKILDGNRRYYASAFLSSDEPTRKNGGYSRIPAFVLPKAVSEADEDAIITEFNFALDMQLPWPYFVKTRAVFKDYDENALNKEELQAKYGIPWRQLDKWIKAARLCDRFLKFHDESFNARQFAYRNMIMFDEMMRNYGARFNDASFREAIFTALLAGYEPENHKNHTFTKSADVVRLDEIFDNADAWQALSARGPLALRDSLGILEISNMGGASDPNPALRRVVKGLEKLVKNQALASANQELLQAFQEKAQQVPGGPTDAAAQIEQMVEWLEGMTTKQVAELPAGALARVERALTWVHDMSVTVVKKQAKA